jgi:drug/metabolite transporter (DMT)-like permease
MTDADAARKNRLRGHLAMALFALLIAVSFSIGHRAVHHIEPGALNAIRFFFGAIIMGAVAYALTPVDARPAFFRPAAVWRYLVLGALMGVYFITMFEALKTTSPVSTGALFTLMPFMSAGFAYIFLRQISGPVVLASLAVAAIGAIWVIFRGDLDAMIAFDIGRGEIIFFFGVAAHGAYAPLVKKFIRDEPVTTFTFWTLAGSWVCITLYALPEIFATTWHVLPASVWFTIAYLAIFTTAGTFFLLQYAATRIPAGKAIAYGYLTPTYIILIEGFAGAGWVSLSVVAGALATVLGLVVMAFAADG